MIQIALETTSVCGTRLRTVMIPNDTDAGKVDGIRTSMLTDGWVGRPILVIDGGDHHIALTGSHRMSAIVDTDIVPEILVLPEDLSPDEFSEILGASDDDDVLAALEAAAAGRDDIDEIVVVMAQEVENN